MAGRYVPVVLVPRFTLFAGASAFYTAPIPAGAYSALTVDFWHGVIIGTGTPAVALSFQEANDTSSWQDCGGGPWSVPGAAGESQYSVALGLSWLQLGVLLSGTDPGVTCWARGFFEMRER